MLLASSIPLVAIIAAIHRSEQTHNQINLANIQVKVTEVQNTFSNYFTHRNEFFNLLASLSERYPFDFVDPSGFYKRVFPDNNSKTMSVEGSSFLMTTCMDIDQLFINFKDEYRKPVQSSLISPTEVPINKPSATACSKKLVHDRLIGGLVEIKEQCGYWDRLQKETDTSKGALKIYAPDELEKPACYFALIMRCLHEVGDFAHIRCSSNGLEWINSNPGGALKLDSGQSPYS